MELKELKTQFIKEELGINEEHGKIFSFIDFANVNNWFNDDDQDWNNEALKVDENIEIYLKGLKEFVDMFSGRARLYYGEDPANNGSRDFTYILRKIFGKRDVVTKDLQKIKHYLNTEEKKKIQKYSETDKSGQIYIEIRKCNFDVEIAVDAYKMIEHYDTFCIFSGDADFVYLNNFLRKKGKKVIIIKAGHILTKLKKSADMIINAQRIKKYITHIKKQEPD